MFLRAINRKEKSIIQRTRRSSLTPSFLYQLYDYPFETSVKRSMTKYCDRCAFVRSKPG